MVKVGSGFRPVRSFRGWGGGRQTARRSACPRRASGYLLQNPLSRSFASHLLYVESHEGDCSLQLWHTGGNGGLSVGVGLQAYHFLKCSQIPRYGFNGGSHARLWLGSAARNARDARFRDRFSASLAALASLVPRTVPPPAADHCFGSCGKSAPAPGGCPSRDSSSASAAWAPWRYLRRR